MEELALLIVSKTGPGDDVETITSKVIDDYYGAKQSIIIHFEALHRAAKAKEKLAKSTRKDAKSKKKAKSQPKSTKKKPVKKASKEKK